MIGGDTATIGFGVGTIASRSTVTAGNAVYQAATKLKDRVLALTEPMLEASAADPRSSTAKCVSEACPGSM